MGQGRLRSLVVCALLGLLLGCTERAERTAADDDDAGPDGGSEHMSPDSDAAPAADALPSGDAEPSVDASSTDAALDADADADLTGECAGATPLQCGDRFADSTPAEGEDRFGLYACTARAESGPEKVYALATDAQCNARVSLSGLETDLDLFAFDRCDALSCTQMSNAPLDIQDIERIEIAGAPQRTQLVVVDGYSGSSGSYTLAVDCLCGEGAADFGDGMWRLEVNRRWEGAATSVPNPASSLEDADYAPVDGAPAHDVQIARRWQLATIGDTPWEGEFRQSTGGQLHYELTQGTAAGGRFLIWSTPAGLEAELTIYGSGVPIALSERGRLVRK